MYFRDDAAAAARRATSASAGRSRRPKVGNLTAVYTQNGNGSKVDVFQQRDDRRDRPAAPGRLGARPPHGRPLENPTPPYSGTGPDPRGLHTRWATNLVINLMPPGAKVIEQPTVELASAR